MRNKEWATISWLFALVLLSGCGGGSSADPPPEPPPDPPPQGQTYTYTALHTFRDGAEGRNPTAGLIRDASGNLYGTTTLGGDLACPDGFGGGCGTVFKIDSSGVLTTLHAFAGGPSNGAFPQDGLIQDASGQLYGTTGGGGSRDCIQGCGTVFKMDAVGSMTVLYYFAGGAAGSPNGRLLRDAAKNLYGTTANGGDLACVDSQNVNGCGTVFRLDPNGVFKTLHAFTGGSTDGAIPNSGLLRDATGNLYGTTGSGGDHQYGTVFKLDTTGRASLLHHFTGEDGAYPRGALIADEASNFYGTTSLGGNLDCSDGITDFGCGTIFKLDPGGTLTTLRVFGDRRTDLTFPSPNLIRDAAGNIYGITLRGGTHGFGALFRLNSAGGGETPFYSFTGIEQGIDRRLAIIDSAGNFYGAAFGGGDIACDAVNGGCGVVFKIGPH
jgi:uncharacterized repeat protein (TIGR03803 family)